MTSSGAARPKNERGAVIGLLAMAGLIFWLGYTRPAGLKVPSWVAYLCSFTVAMSALALFAKASGRVAANNAFAALTLLAFAATGGWIALSANGSHGCKVGVGSSSVDAASSHLVDASPTACRIAFGSGAVMCLLMAAWALALWWQSRRTAPGQADGTAA